MTVKSKKKLDFLRKIAKKCKNHFRQGKGIQKTSTKIAPHHEELSANKDKK